MGVGESRYNIRNVCGASLVAHVLSMYKALGLSHNNPSIHASFLFLITGFNNGMNLSDRGALLVT